MTLANSAPMRELGLKSALLVAFLAILSYKLYPLLFPAPIEHQGKNVQSLPCLVRSSHYYQSFNPRFAHHAAPDKMIATALKLAEQLDDSPYPKELTVEGEWNKLPRYVNLADLSSVPKNTIRILLSNAKPLERFEVSPKYYSIITCYRSLQSEYQFIREEGYRCLRDLNRNESLKEWPNDIPQYHPQSLVIARNAAVSLRGYLHKNDWIFLPNDACMAWHEGENYYMEWIKVDKPVFVITNYWMDAIHHVMGESLGRLAPFFHELMANPDILIHIPWNVPSSMAHKAAELLGIPLKRLVSGRVFSPIVLIPEIPLHCGVPSPTQLRALHPIMVERLNFHFPEMKEPNFEYKNWIVLIKRSGERRMANHDHVYTTIYNNFPHKEIKVYDDKDSLSLVQIQHLFRHAALIVGPHGAGMGNMIVSRPGTYVVEVLTNDRLLNKNFAMMAQPLGIKYHGFCPHTNSTYRGTITADLRQLEEIFQSFSNDPILS